MLADTGDSLHALATYCAEGDAIEVYWCYRSVLRVVLQVAMAAGAGSVVWVHAAYGRQRNRLEAEYKHLPDEVSSHCQPTQLDGCLEYRV